MLHTYIHHDIHHTHLGYGILGGKKSGIWDMRAKKSGIWDMGKSSGIWDIGVEIINF